MQFIDFLVDDDEEDENSNHSIDDDDPQDVGKAAEKVDRAPMDSNTDFQSASSVDKSLKLNYPVVITQYVCPETENEKVLIVVSLPGGATDPDIALQDDGFWVLVKYTWSKTLFTVRDLFKPQLDDGEFQEYHPMPTAYKNGLYKVRKRIDLAPNGLIKVFLPIKVQTTASSYKIWGIKRPDGTNIALATFTGFTKEYVTKAADQKIKYL